MIEKAMRFHEVWTMDGQHKTVMDGADTTQNDERTKYTYYVPVNTQAYALELSSILYKPISTTKEHSFNHPIMTPPEHSPEWPYATQFIRVNIKKIFPDVDITYKAESVIFQFCYHLASDGYYTFADEAGRSLWLLLVHEHRFTRS